MDVLAGHRRTSNVATRRIADQARHIADQKDHSVPKILEMLHLAEQDRVAQVQVGRGWIEAGLNTQRPTERKSFAQILLANQFGQALLQVCKLFFNRDQPSILSRSG